MSERGVIAIDRGVFDHECFADEPFTEREAWLWLIAEAAWKPRTRRIGRAVVELVRGQLAASLRFMADRWGWNKDRVDRFLTRLKNRDMIETASETGISVITIRNYDTYQKVSLPIATTAATPPETVVRQQRDKRENIKSIKGDKKDIRAVADATRPSDDPFEAFWRAYPKRDGANPKAPARKKYLTAVKSGADPGEIEAAVKRFAAECRTKGIVGSPYVPQALTWLNQQRWGDYAPPAGPSDAGPPVPPNPNLPSHEELQRKYGRDNGTAATAPESDRRGQDHPGKLLHEGHGDDPENLPGQRSDDQTRNGGIRRLGEVFRRSPALAALGDQGNGRAEFAGDDGPGAMAGMVRS